jgi:NAD(P)-dependent dehydrogenase (short-subunit alcohol dehydrogenase family)
MTGKTSMTDLLRYQGKRVIVTGCFSGMGEATAKLLLELGAEVHGFDYKACGLPLASFTHVDLREPGSIEAGVKAVGGGIDALFNCAGLPEGGAFDAKSVVTVNFIGTRHLTECVIPMMRDGGAIASIASTAGLGWSQRIPLLLEFVTTKGFASAAAWADAHPELLTSAYGFSKEALIVWTQYMGAHLIKRGIRINCSLPSPTQTPMMATFQATAGKAVIDAAAEPLGRYTTPAEQAAPLVLLCSEAMSVVNGIVLPVDGGFLGGLATGQVDLSKIMTPAKS